VIRDPLFISDATRTRHSIILISVIEMQCEFCKNWTFQYCLYEHQVSGGWSTIPTLSCGSESWIMRELISAETCFMRTAGYILWNKARTKNFTNKRIYTTSTKETGKSLWWGKVWHYSRKYLKTSTTGRRKFKMSKMMEGFCFVISIIGLSRPNAVKDVDEWNRKLNIGSGWLPCSFTFWKERMCLQIL
jgi:hypothetical protein